MRNRINSGHSSHPQIGDIGARATSGPPRLFPFCGKCGSHTSPTAHPADLCVVCGSVQIGRAFSVPTHPSHPRRRYIARTGIRAIELAPGDFWPFFRDFLAETRLVSRLGGEVIEMALSRPVYNPNSGIERATCLAIGDGEDGEAVSLINPETAALLLRVDARHATAYLDQTDAIWRFTQAAPSQRETLVRGDA